MFWLTNISRSSARSYMDPWQLYHPDICYKHDLSGILSSPVVCSVRQRYPSLGFLFLLTDQTDQKIELLRLY